MTVVMMPILLLLFTKLMVAAASARRVPRSRMRSLHLSNNKVSGIVPDVPRAEEEEYYMQRMTM